MKILKQEIEHIRNKMLSIKKIQERRIELKESTATNEIHVLRYGECLDLLEVLGENVSDLEFKK